MIADDRCANDLQNRGPYHNNGTAPLTSQLENWGGSLNLTFNFTDALSLKSISSYRGTSWEGNRDADNTPLPILHTFYDVDGWQWSQELQLLYQGGPLKGVFGAYYFEQASDDIVTITLNPPVPPPGPNLDSDNNKVENQSWAVFTQWTYTFFDTARRHGRRPLHGGQEGLLSGSVRLFGPERQAGAGAVVPRHLQQVHAVGLSRLQDSPTQAMMYVSYSEGFKGGGWNSHFNQPPPPPAFLAQVQEFQPEEAQTYEVGRQARSGGQHVAPERCGVHHRLQ